MPLAENADITLYYAPRSRAFRMLWFLEELGRPYRIEHARPRQGRPQAAGVPEAQSDGQGADAWSIRASPIAETGAILAHLADKYSPGELAPLIKDPRRADYLKWLFFAAGVMEPAFGEKFFKWEVPARQRRLGQFRRHGEDGHRRRVAAAPGCSAINSPPPTSSSARTCTGDC